MENKDQIASFDTGDESKFVDKHRSNVKSDLIEITEDKLENILLKHLKKNWHKKGLGGPTRVIYFSSSSQCFCNFQ